MRFSDEILTAYADGELDEATRHAVDAALHADTALARRVAQLQAQRAAFAPQAGEQVRHGMSAPRRGAKVVQLAAVRATRAATQSAARKARKAQRWSWLEWGAMTLMLVVGVAIGKFGLASWQPVTTAPAGVAWRDGALVAQGQLAVALEQAPGGAGVYGGGVRMGASLVAADGSYCRSFIASGGAQDLAGLACKYGELWRMTLLQQSTRLPRQGGAELPAAVLTAIEQRSAGPLLDARAEQDAMRRGWQR
ncbi:MAG: hypothetical protein V4724_22430 [Pseudomonadota bacterium]